MADVRSALEEIVGAQNLLAGDAAGDDYAHDEALTAKHQLPAFVVKPASTEEVAGVIAVAREHKVPVTARGSGTGLCGSCIPREDGILISFERMNAILEIDTKNHVAVVQPGVTLDELDKATAEHGFVYPVYPGENSASLGGNVATNAGGLRAVKYGVTRHQVLGLTAVLGTGEVIRTGGRFVKATTGYDLTQIIIGSEGTLALATEATLKLYPRAEYATTLLAPFSTLDQITAIVPTIIASGVAPLIVEYIDFVSMNGILTNAGLDLGIPQNIKETALAYLVVVLEDRRSERLEENVEEMATLIGDQGALDIYVLPPQAGVQLIHARERAFWAAKAAGANDIIDMVVPRAAIPQYMAKVNELAQASGSFLTGCGHVGDGNVHLSVFQADEGKRHALIRSIFEAGMALGGAISGEHGIGTEKKPYYTELEQPSKLDLMRRIKTAFDPDGILNPGKIFD
jgi:glycolate oxidase